MSKLTYYIYSFLFYLAMPFILIRLLLRSRKIPAYRQRWRERFGFIHPPFSDNYTIWVHAVSYGEANVAAALIKVITTKTLQH